MVTETRGRPTVEARRRGSATGRVGEDIRWAVEEAGSRRNMLICYFLAGTGKPDIHGYP
jgi:hypothetical protein